MAEEILILLIEDNPGDALLVQEELSETRGVSYCVLHADRLATGLQLLAEQHVDALLLDLGLPDSQGLDTVIAAHTRYPELPIIVLSGLHDETTALDALKCGAQDYLLKGTIHRAMLSRVLRYAIERQRLRTELIAGETRARRLIEENADGIVVVDRQWIVRFANPAAHALFGKAGEQLLGKLFVLPRSNGSSFEQTILREGGDSVTVDMRAVKSTWEGEPAEIISLRDITARKLAETRVATQVLRLDALRRIDTAITGSFDLRLMLNVVLEQATALLDMDAACVMLLDPGTLTLEVAASRGFRTPMARAPRIRLGESFAGRAALERRSVMAIDPERIAGSPAFAALWAAEGFAAYAGVPLIVKGEVKGVLEVFHRSPRTDDAEWRGFLETLAGQTAIAIDNTQLFKHLQRSNLELSLAYDRTIEGWSRALDLRDRETEGHTLRVAEVTERLAKAMGIGTAETIHIRRGALLHDIGKMGVPDAILLKPGPLTAAEWEIMSRHPQFAHDMLSPISYLSQALDIPYCHHEKWDGSGYPRGLKGEQIPLAPRLFSVVDVWDALRSDRPYRAAWSERTVLKHISSLAGTHFDPQVVAVFLKVVSDNALSSTHNSEEVASA